MIEGIDFFLYFIHLPLRIGGGSCMNEDGTYTIYINDLLSRDKQERAYLHELSHILLGHFERNITTEQAEYEANRCKPLLRFAS